MQQALPHIPGDAPFSPQQRDWLNGLLADLLTRTAENAVSAPATVPIRLTIYFATQSGTAERLAKKLLKQMKASGHIADLLSLESATPAVLGQEENAIFVVSTYGEGDPPDCAKRFRDALQDTGAHNLTKLRYAVFCLGDRHYEHFCQFGIELDERLHALGATRLIPRVESGVDVDEPFAAWLRALEPTLVERNTPASSASGLVAEDKATRPELPQRHTRDNPYVTEVRARQSLTSGTSGKQTIHLSFAVDRSEVHYHAGDACGVIAQNDPSLVHELISLLPFDGSVSVEIPKVGRFSITEALLRHLQPTRLTRKMVQAFADKTQRKKLLRLLQPEHATELEAFIYGRGLIDLMHDYPSVIASPDDFVQMLPRLAPRLYSISSSPAAHAGEIHCTVAVVRYRAHNRERSGVASTMLAERVEAGTALSIYIQPNKNFRLPSDTGTPIIMIGPGTGVAPFRAFLHERQALGHTGRNWLFFGERSAHSDFLYQSELLTMQKTGHLTRLDTAFSRDQARKIYVQDRMLEQGAELWRWLNEGAHVFVCGDASRMAKDVDTTLHAIAETHGAMDAEAAREYVSQLHDERRYHRDVY